MLEKSKDYDRPIGVRGAEGRGGDVGVELIQITETAVLAEFAQVHIRAYGDPRAPSHDRNVGAGRGLDKFPFFRKYL